MVTFCLIVKATGFNPDAGSFQTRMALPGNARVRIING